MCCLAASTLQTAEFETAKQTDFKLLVDLLTSLALNPVLSLIDKPAVPEPEPQAALSPEEPSPPAPDAEILAPTETTEPPPGWLHTFIYPFMHA